MANTNSLGLVLTSSQYAYINDNASLSITGNLSIMAWVYLATGSHVYDPIVGKWNDTGDKRSYYFFLSSTNSTIGFQMSTDGTWGTNSSSKTVSYTVPIGSWIHVAMTYSTSGDVKFYVNGIQQGTTQTGAKTSIANLDQQFRIGESNAAYLNGYIDEVKIWADTLTDAQIISEIYSKNPLATNLRGYWNFNNSLSDLSGQSNTLSLSGSPSYSSLVPFVNYANEGGSFLMNFV